MVESLTYAEIAARLGVTAEAARSLAKRHRLPRRRGNDGKARVEIDVDELQHTPVARSSGGHRVITILRVRIVELEAELVAVRAEATGHRADFERERDRGDRLVAALAQLGRRRSLWAWLTGRATGWL